MPDFVAKIGHTGPAMRATLLNPDGSAADLSSGTVRLKVYHPNGRVVLDKAAVIVTPAEGVVQFTPAAGDFSQRGLYKFEFVHYPAAGGSIPYPSDRSWVLEVVNSA